MVKLILLLEGLVLSESELNLEHASMRYQALVQLIKVFSSGIQQAEAPLPESQLFLTCL